MLTAALRGLVDKFQLHGERIGEVAAGAVLKHSRDFNLCRESVMSSGLAPETAAYDLQMACGTGLHVAINISNTIALGQLDGKSVVEGKNVSLRVDLGGRCII